MQPGGLTVFFTGLSGAGKTTVASALVGQLAECDARAVTLLDGDVVRQTQTHGLGFSREDRERNIEHIGTMAAGIAHSGGVAVCAAIAPYESMRRTLRARLAPAGGFLLVHMATPLEVCESRDPKGLYARARAGRLLHFTGVSDPYEVPSDADLRLDATDTPADVGARLVVELLAARGWLALRAGQAAAASPL
jgi:sulfate adenylyltransferase